MPDDVEPFIELWSHAAASERANAQQFVIELADLLGVPRPGNDHDAGYSFEFPLKIPRADGTFTQGFIDLYRRASFVLEAKQFQSEPSTPLLVLAGTFAKHFTRAKVADIIEILGTLTTLGRAYRDGEQFAR